MRQIGPIERRFRHKLEAFKYLVKDNWLKRRIVFLLEKMLCLLTCEADAVTATISVTDEVTLLRYPDLWATKTVISNTGLKSATIYENDVICGIVPAGESKVFVFANRFIIDGKCADSESTTLVITTHRRCECGEEVDPKPYGVTIAPVGGDLI